MPNLNVLYDGRYDDVDVICIPNDIVDIIEELAQEYLDWMPPDDDADNWVIINNKKCMAKGALGFIKWLNSSCCLSNQAYLVSKNVQFCPTYQTVEF